MAENTGEASPAKPRERGTRMRTVWFIVVFVGSVILLLTAYRYAIDTRANDRYLFYVAAHTSWVLDKIGNSAELEGRQRDLPRPAELRAALAAWRRGEDTPTPEAIAKTPNHPLTTLERYTYRIESKRRANYTGTLGPRVFFLLRPGITHAIQEIQERRADINSDATRTQEAKREQLQALDARLAALRAEQKENAGDPEKRRLNSGYFFNFVVIPECGAIEVMAIFFAAVIAFPTRWWKRLVGIAAGIPIMYLVNILRLSCLAVIGALDRTGKWFNFSHHYAWQAVYIIFVVAVWLAWVEFLVHRRSR